MGKEFTPYPLIFKIKKEKGSLIMGTPHIVLFFHNTPASNKEIETKISGGFRNQLVERDSSYGKQIHVINTNNSIVDTVKTATEFYGKQIIFLTVEMSNTVSKPHPDQDCVVFYYKDMELSLFESMDQYKTQKLKSLFTMSDVHHQLYLVINSNSDIDFDAFTTTLSKWVSDLITYAYPQISTISPEEKMKESYTVLAPGNKKILTHTDKYLCCKICDKYNGAKVVDYEGNTVYDTKNSKVHPINPGLSKSGVQNRKDIGFVHQLPRMKS